MIRLSRTGRTILRRQEVSMEERQKWNLWYRTPADAWYQGMPVGNGRIGGMVRGGLDTDVLSVNEDTLWSGKPFVSSRTESHKAFEKIKAFALEGKMQEAAELAALEFSDVVTQMYLPLGDIAVSFPGHENAENYTRTLDLETGIATVNYTVNGVGFTREIFVSRPDEVLVYRVTADAPEALSCTVKLKSVLQCEKGEKDGCLTLSGNCPNYVFVRGRETKPAEGYAYGERDEDKGVGYYALLCGETDKGPAAVKDGVICVESVQSLVLYFGVRTSFNGFDKHPVLEGREYVKPCEADIAAVRGEDYAAIKKRHIEDVKPLFGRMSLELPHDENEGLPTDERLIRHGAGEKDRGLYALLFHFARYLTIASSRPGTQVTNLQGIWNDQLVPPWGCNCTVNINTEMNYWPTLRFGLAECYKPLIDMVKELSKAGTATARDYYAAPGFVCHSATDLWRMCHPQNNGIPGSAQWGFWSGSSGWLSCMLWDYYAFTGDKAYLEDVWPQLLGAAEFYRHLLCEKDGELILPACTSPENNYLIGEDACPVDYTTEMSMAICRDIFRCVIDAAKILGKEEGEAYAALAAKLRPMQVRSDDGRINEWYGEYPDWEVHHRHISHLYGLFPGRETMTPELSDAVKKVLNVRGDPSTGWSIAWKTNCWARLGDGDRAEHVLDMQLQPVAGTEEISMLGDGGTFLSMLCAHPPFQIDGNFGAASAIMEMLIWNEGDEVRLLPALPSDWDHGSVSGICLHGGGKISFAWEKGRIIECRITGGYETYRVTHSGGDIAYAKCLTLKAGRPENFGLQEREIRAYDLLEKLSIPVSRVDHEPAWTMEDCTAAERVLGAPIVKNLFLTNRQKTKFYLLLMPADKPFLTKELSAQIGSARLSFAGAEELLRLLDVYPGSASVLALMNDREKQVQLLIDRDVLEMEAIGCHPCRNTASLKLSVKTLLDKILPAMKHDYLPVTLKGE